MTFMKERKAISPVIATVILVAVAITVAVGVSYWMSGISSQYTQFEKVEIQTGYATAISANYWNVTLSIKNSGSASATITHAFLNDVPCDNYGVKDIGAGLWSASIPVAGMTLEAGESGYVYVVINQFTTLTSGTTVNIKLHSAGGMDYIKLIRLP